MTIWGKLAGAAAGLALGGPIGALLGVFAGHFVVDHWIEDDGPTKRQVAFTVGVIALGAKMAKSDGVVVPEEVEAFREVFKVPDGEHENVAKLYNLAKQDVAGFDAYARQVADIMKDDPAILADVLDGLFHIAKADNVFHPSEIEFLSAVATLFGFSDDEFSSIKARHVIDDTINPYAVLGIDQNITDEDLKSHYRQLVIENHPDKFIARGAPEEFIRIANERLKSINEAYDMLAKDRGL